MRTGSAAGRKTAAAAIAGIDTGGRAAIGNIASGIQAGNALSVSSGGQIVNTGNLMGAAVDITGAAMVNGITSPNQPDTPPAAPPTQVISLGPPPVPAGKVSPGAGGRRRRT